MARPSTLTPWDTNGTDSTQPVSARQTDGWADGAPVKAYDNWMKNEHYDWIRYLRSSIGILRASVWTERANPKNFRLRAVAHDQSGLWVAVGQADGTNSYIITSPDGEVWTERSPTVAKNIELYSVAHDGSGLWVAVGEADGTNAYILSSTDGTTWTERSPTVDKNLTLYAVAHDQSGLWVAVGEADGTNSYILTSTDGTTWAERSPTVDKNLDLYGVAHNGSNLWVAVGDLDGADADSYVLTSPDGITWTEQPCPRSSAGGVNSVVYSVAQAQWVIVGSNYSGDASIFTSPDGSVWTERTNSTDYTLLCVIYHEWDFWLAVGASDGVRASILTSDDGINWSTSKSNPKAFDLFGVAQDQNGNIVAVGAADGTDSYIITSLSI